jgi:NAD(P)H-nitrite reductase large subunit
MSDNLNEEILDKLTKVCICKAIPRSKIKEAIRNGADTLEKVQKVTGAGSGGCGGRRCTPKINELLSSMALNSQNNK